ncbi:hypothetical protein KL921_005395 [Ogataea angusta]|nr:hypothetical protein KL921_005395 [Ogataea angusta]
MLLHAIRLELADTSIYETRVSADTYFNRATPARLEHPSRRPSVESLDPAGNSPLTWPASPGPLQNTDQTQDKEYTGKKVLGNDSLASSFDDESVGSDQITREETCALKAVDKNLISGTVRDDSLPKAQSIKPAAQGVHSTAFSTDSSVDTSLLVPEDAFKRDNSGLASDSLESSISRTKSFSFKNTVPSDREMDAFGFQSQLDSDDYFSSDSELSRSSDDLLSSKTQQSLTLYAKNSLYQTTTSGSSPSRYFKSRVAESGSTSELRRGGELHFTKDKPGPSFMQNHSTLTDLLKENVGLENNLSNVTHNDKALRCLISVPRLSIGFENPIPIKIDESFSVEDVIQSSLSQIRRLSRDKGRIFSVDLNPKLWNLYLADDDGQVDDDMGPLERNRLLISYCADEFVLDFKSKDDYSQNDMKRGLDSSSVLEDTTRTGPGSIETLGFERIAPLNHLLHATSIGSEITFDDKKNEKNSFFGLNSKRLTPGQHSQQGRDVEPPITKPSDNGCMCNGTESNFETMQTSSSHHVSRRKRKFQTLLQFTGLNGNDLHNSKTNQGEPQTINDRYLGSGTYYRWTIWRRQQMSFKGRYPKSLVIDGRQIYILPFNESKGSWYESKTTSFNFNQIIKVKQNPRIPHYFKIVVVKQNHEAPKTYHLEAANAAESRAIVKTFNLLMERFGPTYEKYRQS